MSKSDWLGKIDAVEAQLKERERSRWSSAERREVESRGETDVDFFRILYKLQVLERMRAWLERNGSLPRSYQKMLKNPKEKW
jgi:hypothetical protein